MSKAVFNEEFTSALSVWKDERVRVCWRDDESEACCESIGMFCGTFNIGRTVFVAFNATNRNGSGEANYPFVVNADRVVDMHLLLDDDGADGSMKF